MSNDLWMAYAVLTECQRKATMTKTALRSFVVVTYSAMVSGYKPTIIFTVHARDIDHAREKLSVLFRPLQTGESLISYQDYLSDNSLVREQIGLSRK